MLWRQGSRAASFFCLAAGLALVTPPVYAESGVIGGFRFGYYVDAEEPFAGGELLFELAPSVYFNPNLELVFREDHYFSVNADFHYDFPSHGRTLLWAGAGLGLVSIDPPGGGDGDTDAALNLLFGVGLSRGGVVPYFQTKLIVMDDSEVSLAFGLRF